MSCWQKVRLQSSSGTSRGVAHGPPSAGEVLIHVGCGHARTGISVLQFFGVPSPGTQTHGVCAALLVQAERYCAK